MASAAAVAADQALSPEPTAVAEQGSTVTSAILPSDEKAPDDLGELNEDDEDEDDVVRSRPRGPQMQMNGAPQEEEEEELGDDDDLFGDEEEADEAPPQQRTLDDEDLDSGDDEDRIDRIADEEDAQPEEEQEQAIMEAALGRQPVPEPSDGEMYLTKVPAFLSIDPKVWHHTKYQPPQVDHHSNKAGLNFSSYNTAVSTVHWRKSPSNPSEIQSNARILRWSDGTLTLQFASNPSQQFIIDGNPLAPRQINPIKPTPTSKKSGQHQKDHAHDSFTYLTMPDPHNQLLRISHKITAGLSILPSEETTDDALVKLRQSLAEIAQGKNKSSGIEILTVTEDPELAKKKAEVAEKEKMRAQKRREAAETRERERSGRTLGRSRGYGGGGLSASMLEDDEMGGAGARPKGKREKVNRRMRRNSEYSDDEDFGRKRGNFANDEYDEEDEFIARSDEEEEAILESDSDDGIMDDPAPKRKGGAKRASPAAGDDDEDAEGEEEEEVVQASRVKRRRVVDDDDEE